MCGTSWGVFAGGHRPGAILHNAGLSWCDGDAQPAARKACRELVSAPHHTRTIPGGSATAANPSQCFPAPCGTHSPAPSRRNASGCIPRIPRRARGRREQALSSRIEERAGIRLRALPGARNLRLYSGPSCASAAPVPNPKPEKPAASLPRPGTNLWTTPLGRECQRCSLLQAECPSPVAARHVTTQSQKKYSRQRWSAVVAYLVGPGRCG